MMTVTEPVTVLTDYVLAAANAVFGIRLLLDAGPSGQRCVQLWSAAFFATSAAAMLGGTYHGLAHNLPPWAAVSIWRATLYSVGLAGLLMLAGEIRATSIRPWRECFWVIAIVKFMVFAFWMLTHDRFLYVILDYLPSMLAVLSLAIYDRIRRRSDASPWLIGGIAVSILAAALQAWEVRPHRHFNHNDLYHVIQTGASWLFYRGARRLMDR